MRCWLVSLILVPILLTCSFDEPKAPSWNTTLNFPVAENNILMSNLVQENDNVFDYGDGLLGLRVEGELDTTWVSQSFIIDNIEQSIDMDVLDLSISRLNVDMINFTPPLLVPGVDSFYGQAKTIEPVPFTNVSGNLLSEQTILSITIATGIARLTFTNDLPVDVEFSEIKLVELLTGQVKLLHTKPVRIQAGAVDSLDLDLSNKILTKNDHWFVSGISSSNGKDVVIQENDSFGFKVDFVDLRLVTLSAKNLGLTVEKRDSVRIGESVCVRRATFRAGKITFDIENSFLFDLAIHIKSPHFIHKSSQSPLQVNTVVQAKSIVNIVLNLSDYIITFDGALQVPQCLAFVVTAESAESEKQITNVHGNDTVKFKFGLRDAIIDEFKGRLDSYQVPLTPVQRQVNMPEHLGQFQGLYLEQARLCIDFYNTLEMPIQLEGVLNGRSHDGKEASLPIKTAISAGGISQEELTRYACESEENSDVLRLVKLLPHTIQFAGTAWVGDGDLEGSITPQSYLRAHYLLETPAYVAWNETVLVPDTTYFQVNPLDYSGGKIHKNTIQLEADDVSQLESFCLVTDIDNHLPVTGTIALQLKETKQHSAEAFELWLSPVEVQSAKIDVHGRIQESWKQKSEIILNKQDLGIFKNDTDTPKLLMLVTTITLHSTEGQKVKVYDTDYLTLKSAAQLVIAINKR
ncbi:hypothetical protein EH223_09985 [candidate division KSB1 bacterium]|nr:hypothetical protein [candidate division KSB1 bacterium]RQW03436.1 MAG: hypothetical protein EH223_09985 [candidate division KSB1 bacterium]